MPASRKLKVFRTAIGFHDAYVAAPSKKAALAAWGSTKDLFAIGSAEQVTDPKLTSAPLAKPGEVVKLARGSTEDHLRAASRDNRPKSANRKSVPARLRETPSRPTKPAPRPSRRRLDQAELALAKFEAEAKIKLASLREREAQIARERAVIETSLAKARGGLEKKLASARSAHEDALARWRDKA